MGEVALGGHRSHSHPGKVRPRLEDHVAGVPGGVELPVEPEQVVQLQSQDILEAKQRPALNALPGGQRVMTGEQPGERGEVE